MAGQCKILIVEAEDELREKLVSSTAPVYDVDAVVNGQGMCEALQATNYHVVIINTELPDHDAIALARYAEYRRCGVIIIPEHPRQAVQSAAYGYHILRKPFRTRRLFELIENASKEAGADCSATDEHRKGSTGKVSGGTEQ